VSRYIVGPRAARDLDDQAIYLATEASPDVGRRFLESARRTFAPIRDAARNGLAVTGAVAEVCGRESISRQRVERMLRSPAGRAQVAESPCLRSQGKLG
jgi:plasmid stabilization system protein ParE